MGFPSNPSIITLIFLSILLLISPNPIHSAPEYSALVYKGCAKQAFQDPTGLYSQALSALFGTLVQQSTKTKFFKTTTGTGQTTITGLFQCRGDLSAGDCYNRQNVRQGNCCSSPALWMLHPLRGCWFHSGVRDGDAVQELWPL
ncbi:Plasmodesmata-located protein 3 [Linum perenne]